MVRPQSQQQTKFYSHQSNPQQHHHQSQPTIQPSTQSQSQISQQQTQNQTQNLNHPYNLRNKKPQSTCPTSHEVTKSLAKIPLETDKEFQLLKELPRDVILDEISQIDVQAASSTNDDLAWLKVESIIDNKTILIPARPDTGADISLLNKKMAVELKLKVEQCPSFIIRASNGDLELCNQKTTITTNLTLDSPIRHIDIFITENTPPGDYMLLGRVDLSGFSVNMTIPPSISG